MRIPIGLFNERYELCDSAVYNAITAGVPKSVLSKVEAKGSLTVDEQFFIRRVDFKNKVVEFCQDYYYYLTEFFPASNIAKECVKYTGCSTVSSMSVFMHEDLFKTKDSGILNYKIWMQLWNLFRYFRAIDRVLKRRNRNFNVSNILDRRMQNGN